MNEKTFYQHMKRHLAKYDVHMQRLESITGRGIPDVVYRTKKKVGFIEFKYTKQLPKKWDSKLSCQLTGAQYYFLKTWGEVCPCFVFVQAGLDLFFVPDQHIEESLTRKMLFSMGRYGKLNTEYILKWMDDEI